MRDDFVIESRPKEADEKTQRLSCSNLKYPFYGVPVDEEYAFIKSL